MGLPGRRHRNSADTATAPTPPALLRGTASAAPPTVDRLPDFDEAVFTGDLDDRSGRPGHSGRDGGSH